MREARDLETDLDLRAHFAGFAMADHEEAAIDTVTDALVTNCFAIWAPLVVLLAILLLGWLLGGDAKACEAVASFDTCFSTLNP